VILIFLNISPSNDAVAAVENTYFVAALAAAAAVERHKCVFTTKVQRMQRNVYL